MGASVFATGAGLAASLTGSDVAVFTTGAATGASVAAGAAQAESRVRMRIPVTADTVSVRDGIGNFIGRPFAHYFDGAVLP
jgi:hypothetical protein